MRPPPPAQRWPVLLLALVVAGACSSPPPTSPTVTAGAAATASTPSPSTTPATSTPPATVDAGPLSAANVPPPASLGSQWSTNASPAPQAHGPPDTSWLTARDPVDVTAALAPIGCSGLSAAPHYPVPAHALQGRFVSAPQPLNAVVLVLDYPDETAATTLMTDMARDIARCPAPKSVGPQTPYTRAITVTTANSTRIEDHWTELGVGAGPNAWHEVVVREGARVGLADVEAAPDQTPDLAPLVAVLEQTIRR